MGEFIVFCSQHVATQENESDCGAHLAEGRVFPCLYRSVEEATALNAHGLPRCVDFEPLDGGDAD